MRQLPRPFELGARPWIAAHRGAAPEPENSLAGFARAVAEGADLLECDAQLTADGELALFHDETLARFAGGDDRRTEDLTLAELKRIELRTPSRAGGAATIPSLGELLASLPAELPLNVELKRYRANPARLVESTLALIGERPNVLVSSFDWDLLAELRHAGTGLPLAPLAERFSTEVAAFATEIEAWAIHLGSTPSADVLRELARPVLRFTVNDPLSAREMLAQGVAGIFTDRPGGLRRDLSGDPAASSLGPGPRGVV